MMTPPAPWIGSATKAPIQPSPIVLDRLLERAAAMRPNSSGEASPPSPNQ